MCFVEPRTSSNSIPTTTTPSSPRHAGSKRPLEMTIYDPAAAAEAEQRANAAALSVALVPYAASSSSSSPINAIPLAAFSPEARAEPRWLRREMFPRLKLRGDLPAHFIAEKAVTATDLDRHQNRFRLPSEGVMRNLRPLLSPLELAAANLLHGDGPRPRPRPPKQQQLVLEAAPAGDQEQQQGKEKKKKRKGKKHGGLPVLVVGYNAGVRELQMSRWESSRGIIIKGEGYLSFLAKSSFKVDDVVEIWAFKERAFRLFGSNVCADGPLYVLIAKKG